jgi:hypothetical protein
MHNISEIGSCPIIRYKWAKDPTELGLLEVAGLDHRAVKEVLGSMYILLPSEVISRR